MERGSDRSSYRAIYIDCPLTRYRPLPAFYRERQQEGPVLRLIMSRALALARVREGFLCEAGGRTLVVLP